MSYSGLNRLVIVLLAGMAVLSGGCVSKPIEPEYIPRVSTAQNNKGLVSISWQSRKDYTYRLVAREQGNVHVDDKVYRGTGEVIVVEFMRDPDRPLPDYSVMPEKIKVR